eukprot:8000716-Pyramimonas_sp.AAC.1
MGRKGMSLWTSADSLLSWQTEQMTSMHTAADTSSDFEAGRRGWNAARWAPLALRKRSDRWGNKG